MGWLRSWVTAGAWTLQPVQANQVLTQHHHDEQNDEEDGGDEDDQDGEDYQKQTKSWPDIMMMKMDTVKRVMFVLMFQYQNIYL